PGATSEWADSFDHRQLIETYVTRDLVRYVDQHYRTIPNAAHRVIGGLSMGGFGAMNIAVHHPDIFGTVISLGGYYFAEGAIWGHNTAYMQKNSPALTLPKNKAVWKLHIYLGAATKDQPYYRDTVNFMHQLSKLHIPYQFDLQTGYHSWRVWQVQMYNAMLWLKW
ncbi:MAG TPA: alpha/beta hydrolase-fold protein, partial [Ktedonobacteraceae bacterium]|nr:alpha/beta hydrolase-fold protein [Ktedonobacteraceae bacterium]